MERKIADITGWRRKITNKTGWKRKIADKTGWRRKITKKIGFEIPELRLPTGVRAVSSPKRQTGSEAHPGLHYSGR
jgi:hypothetical protein